MDKDRFFEKFHSNERVVFFSDGVFAIVVTLLVLELRIPHLHEVASAKELWHELSLMRNKFVSFVLSFLFAINLWFNHNQFFKLLIRIDNVVLWLNNLLLLSVCFLPFPTALIGEYPENSAGMVLFGSVWLIVPVLFYSMGTRALKAKLISDHVDMKRFMEIRKLILYFIPAGLIPLCLAFFYPTVSFAIYILLLLSGIMLGARVKIEE